MVWSHIEYAAADYGGRKLLSKPTPVVLMAKLRDFAKDRGAGGIVFVNDLFADDTAVATSKLEKFVCDQKLGIKVIACPGDITNPNQAFPETDTADLNFPDSDVNDKLWYDDTFLGNLVKRSKQGLMITYHTFPLQQFSLAKFHVEPVDRQGYGYASESRGVFRYLVRFK